MGMLSNFLSNPWMVFLLMNLTLLVVFTAINAKQIAGLFSGISTTTWIAVAVVFLLGFLSFNNYYFFGQHTDGFNQIESSKIVLETGKYFYRCDSGRIGNCLSYNKHTSMPGSAFLISLVFLVSGGIKSYYALALSGFLMSLTTILIFLTAYLSFGRERLSLYAALVFVTIPILDLWSGTGHMRSYGLFFVMLSLLSFLAFMKRDNHKLMLLTIFSTSFAIYILKSFMLLVPLYLIFYLTKKRQKFVEDLFSENLNDYLTITGIGLLIFLPALKWMYVYEPTIKWEIPKFSFDYFIPQAFGILLMYFDRLNYDALMSSYYIATVSVLAFGYYLFVLKKKRWSYYFFGLLFVAMFFMNSTYVIHGFYNLEQTFSLSKMQVFISGDFIRHTVSMTPIYSILAGFTLQKLEDLLSILSDNLKHILPVAFMSLLIVSGGLTMPEKLMKDQRTSGPLNENAFELVNKTPDNAFIISFDHLIVQSDVFPNNKRRSFDVALYDYEREPVETLLKENKDNSYLITRGCSRSYFEEICGDLKDHFRFNRTGERGPKKLYRLEPLNSTEPHEP